jgi:hypothetical protein
MTSIRQRKTEGQIKERPKDHITKKACGAIKTTFTSMFTLPGVFRGNIGVLKSVPGW